MDKWEEIISCAIACSRCSGKMKPEDQRILSVYDHQTVCMPCKKAEELRPFQKSPLPWLNGSRDNHQLLLKRFKTHVAPVDIFRAGNNEAPDIVTDDRTVYELILIPSSPNGTNNHKIMRPGS